MKIPILSGMYTTEAGDYRVAYPRNLVPVPTATGMVSVGYLRPADGIKLFATGPGIDRGGIRWNSQMYRVMGTKLVRIDAAGAVTILGDVGAGGLATMDYGFDRLAIWSGGRLYYWDGSTLVQVTDPDLGTVIDGRWIAGYYLSTEGNYIIATDLNDPYSISPLKYGSAESDPDPILAIDELRNEAYALGRYSIEVFQNIGGDNFPFQRIPGALVPRGVVGTHAYCQYLSSFAFVGSNREESIAVHLMTAGDSTKISTREVDMILASYPESVLAGIKVESRSDKAHQHLLIHLPDQTLVYDSAASTALSQQVWFVVDSGIGVNSQYRARGLVWCYDKWLAGDPTSARIGEMTSDVSTHYGNVIGWEFSTQIVYNDGNGGIIHELELVCLPGRVPLGVDPVVWASYSNDGATWSQEKAKSCGKQGERDKRLAWRTQGVMNNWRIQRFRGTSEAHLSVARLEMAIEPLYTRPRNG